MKALAITVSALSFAALGCGHTVPPPSPDPAIEVKFPAGEAIRHERDHWVFSVDVNSHAAQPLFVDLERSDLQVFIEGPSASPSTVGVFRIHDLPTPACPKRVVEVRRGDRAIRLTEALDYTKSRDYRGKFRVTATATLAIAMSSCGPWRPHVVTIDEVMQLYQPNER